MPIPLLFIISIVFGIVIVNISHIIVGALFGGNHLIFQTILEIAIGGITGFYIGKITGRKILYRGLKKTYKKKRKEKGE